MKKDRIITGTATITVALFSLQGCAPMGYVQSPRVSPGVEIGMNGMIRPAYHYSDTRYSEKSQLIEFRDSITEIDTVDQYWYPYGTYFDTTWDSREKVLRTTSESSLLYGGPRGTTSGFNIGVPHFGILDRVRIGAVGYVSPLLMEASYGAAEVMVNICDLGQPHLFKNISVGVLGSTMYSDEYSTSEQIVTGGVLTGTHATTSTGGDVELVFGTGVSYNKGFANNHYHHDYLYYEEEYYHLPSLTPDTVEIPLEYDWERSHVTYLLDFSTSIHYRPSIRKRFQMSAGFTLSPIVKNGEWITIEDNKGNRQFKNVTPGSVEPNVSVQAGFSWRLGGRSGASWIEQHPRIYQCLSTTDSTATLNLKAEDGWYVRVNGIPYKIYESSRVLRNLKPGDYFIETVDNNGNSIDSRIIHLKAGSRKQYYLDIDDLKSGNTDKAVQAW